MKLLFVHECLGALGGAETNIHLTACELKRRGHQVALLHGASTGRNETAWRETFSQCFPLADVRQGQRDVQVSEKLQLGIVALEKFEPEVIYLHNLADLELVEILLGTGVPVVRMVHDHQMYCMRGYKY